MFVRLAKVSKDPSARASPELQKFVDIMACAAIDRMPRFTPANLCSLIWAASKLKKGLPHSGMFKSFLKAWACEMEPHLGDLELEQLRRCMAALTRTAFHPGPAWGMQLEAALAARLSPPPPPSGGAAARPGAVAAAGGDAAGSGAGAGAGTGAGGGEERCACSPRTLACCLVSAASMGLGARPSQAFRQAVGAACAATFADAVLRGGGEEEVEGAGGFVGCSADVAGSDGAGSDSGGGGGGRTLARCACGALWASAVLGVPLGRPTVQAMVSLVTAAPFGGAVAVPGGDDAEARAAGARGGDATTGGSPGVLSPLDYTQVFWALPRLAYTPDPAELSALLGGSCGVLAGAQPELLAAALWALADLRAAPPDPWLRALYDSFSRRLDAAHAEPLQALLHAAASLQLPPPEWSDRLMQRLQDVDLGPLPDGGLTDLVASLRALGLRPPPHLAHRLQEECALRLAAAGGEQHSAAGAAVLAGAGSA